QSSGPAQVGGRITGHVLDQTSRMPLAGARLTLVSIRIPARGAQPAPPITFVPGPPPQAASDADGQFVFDGIAAGRYLLSVQKPGYAPLDGTPGNASSTINLTAGQTISGVDVVLQKGAVIAGRLLDVRGEPLPEMSVAAMRVRTG